MMFTNSHRYFIQFMIKKKCVRMEEAVNYLKKCTDDENTQLDTLQLYIDECGSKISEHGFKLITSKCEVTGDEFLTFINTISDNVAKYCTEYSPAETEYFHEVVKAIISSRARCYEYNGCINMSRSTTQRLTLQMATNLLQKWTKEGYLVEKNGSLYLGARYLIEFTPYLYSHFKDYVKNCILCSNILVYGVSCANCRKRLHEHCMQKVINGHNKCPKCKTEWQAGEELDESDGEEMPSSDEEDY